MGNREIEIIIFDVDRTLSDDVSWLKITEGLGASLQRHEQIFAEFKSGKIEYHDAKRQLVSMWQETGNANKPYMKKMFRSWGLKADAQETIDYLQKSYRVCLISGAVDLYVRIVAEKLGITDWYANTELIWNKNDDLVDFNYFPDQSEKKLEQFNQYVRSNGLNKDKCAVVGEGDSDIALFRVLSVGIAVNKDPHPDVVALATRTVSRLSELKDIF